MRVPRPCLPALALACGLSACAPAPNPASPTVSAERGAEEQRAGDAAYPEVVARYGGVYRDAKLQNYVRSIGTRLAGHTEQPNDPWTFTVLDDDLVNAFATPGGYVYVTRGLVVLADDEAQLASVIGHEMGHVTARHGASRGRQGAVAGVGVALGQIGAAALGLGRLGTDLVGQAGQVAAEGYVASYGRGQELEADALGVRYISNSGYDPLAQAEFLGKLQAQQRLDAEIAGRAYDANSVGFLASHPASGERIRNATAAADRGGSRAGERGRERFLSAIDGMSYGEFGERRVMVITIAPDDTLESLAARSGLPEDRAVVVEKLRVLNGIAPGAQPRTGDKFKQVP